MKCAEYRNHHASGRYRRPADRTYGLIQNLSTGAYRPEPIEGCRAPRHLRPGAELARVTAMSVTLPQQQLLLELLIMSGEIAVPGDAEDAIQWRTLLECRTAGWLTSVEVSPGLFRLQITAKGRRAAEVEG